MTKKFARYDRKGKLIIENSDDMFFLSIEDEADELLLFGECAKALDIYKYLSRHYNNGVPWSGQVKAEWALGLISEAKKHLEELDDKDEVTRFMLDNYREVNPGEERCKLDSLLDRLDPRLRRRRDGAWAALHSDNPDRLSQAANSMVELLDQVIGQVCIDTDLATFLMNRYPNQKTEWVGATRQWIGRTKDNLHSAKHHVDLQSEQVTKTLLSTTENILLLILE